MKPTEFGDFLTWADAQIKDGKGERVAQAISEMNLTGIRRTEALAFSRIARRVGIWSAGLKVLSRLIFDPGRARIVSTNSQELAEYGALLMKNGSLDEALKILGRVDGQKFPEGQLYQAFTHFARWEYREAIELLKTYLKTDLKAYDRLVGQVNLASAYVVTRDDLRGIDLLSSTMDQAAGAGAIRLMGNCLEMRAQIHINQGNLSLAEADLLAADKIFASDHDRLFVEKRWAHLRSVREDTIEPLLRFRALAEQRKHWESVRDTDFYLLKLKPDVERLNHLYFGTPYAAFRERLEEQVDCRGVQETYLYGAKSGPILDMRASNHLGLKEDSQLHRTLFAFIRDFYRPVNYGTLFAQLFPGEHYDAYSSPTRLRQAIRRLRSWLEEKRFPVSLRNDGDYRLEVQGDFGFQLSREAGVPLDRPHRLWQLLQERLGGAVENVSARAAAKVLGLHHASAKRLLRWAVESGQAIRVGHGPSTRYKQAA